MTPHLPEDGESGGGLFAEINITPLTDIFLVLLIIFMVGASMAVDAAAGDGAAGGMEVELPQGSAQEVTPGQSDAFVVILSDGRVVISGVEVKDDELLDHLQALHAQVGSSTLVLQADEGAAHGKVVRVMERAREAGFAKLAVATRGD